MADVNRRTQLTQCRDISCVSEIRTGDSVSHTEQDSGNSAHARTANTDKVHGTQVFGNGLRKVWFYHDYPRLKTICRSVD